VWFAIALNILEMMWRDANMVEFEVQTRLLAWKAQAKPQRTSLRIASTWTTLMKNRVIILGKNY
jgi:hypothetical protein